MGRRWYPTALSIDITPQPLDATRSTDACRPCRPSTGGFAVYCLFTVATGTSWKQLFDSSPSAIRLELGDNQIQAPSPASASKR